MIIAACHKVTIVNTGFIIVYFLFFLLKNGEGRMIVRFSCRAIVRTCIRLRKKAGARGTIRVLIIVMSSDSRGRTKAYVSSRDMYGGQGRVVGIIENRYWVRTGTSGGIRTRDGI